MKDEGDTLTEKFSENRGKYRKAVFDRNTSKKAKPGTRNTNGVSTVSSCFSNFTASPSSDDDMEQFYKVAASSDTNFPKPYFQVGAVQVSNLSNDEHVSQRFNRPDSKASVTIMEPSLRPRTENGDHRNLEIIQQAILSGKVRVVPNTPFSPPAVKPQLTPAQIAHMERNRRIALALRESNKR